MKNNLLKDIIFYFNDELMFTNVYCINYVNSWDVSCTHLYDGYCVVFMFGQNEKFSFEFKEKEDASKFVKMFKNLVLKNSTLNESFACFIDLKKLLKQFCDEENINYLVGVNYEC